jgi:hypothetical protein
MLDSAVDQCPATSGFLLKGTDPADLLRAATS